MRALDAILESEKFVMAPQMSSFLRYVVEQAAHGNQQRIKAYTVAVEALGKPDSFDPQNDPVVRVLAGRLRASLNAYYDAHPDQEVIIQMKPGTYVPEFLMPSNDDETEMLDATIRSEEDDLCLTAANSVLTDADLVYEASPTSKDADMSRAAHPAQATGLADSGMEADSPVPAVTAGVDDPVRTRSRKVYLTDVIRRFPKQSLAIAMLLAFFIGLLLPSLQRPDSPALEAASRIHWQSDIDSPGRQRPDTLSLFIELEESPDPLLHQLYTTMSGILADSSDLQVFRVLRTTDRQRYWPEDYLLSLGMISTAENTQVSVQLLDAQTGRISHAEMLTLRANAGDGLTASELQAVTDHARYLISDDGPLQSDYRDKLED